MERGLGLFLGSCPALWPKHGLDLHCRTHPCRPLQACGPQASRTGRGRDGALPSQGSHSPPLPPKRVPATQSVPNGRARETLRGGHADGAWCVGVFPPQMHSRCWEVIVGKRMQELGPTGPSDGRGGKPRQLSML